MKRLLNNKKSLVFTTIEEKLIRIADMRLKTENSAEFNLHQ